VKTARDPYAELAAIAMTVEINRTIAEADVAKWSAELGNRHAKRLTRAAVWQARGSRDFAVREALVELVPPERFAKDARLEAQKLVDFALRSGAMTIRSSELVVAIALAAPAGGKALFERIVEAAAKNTAFSDEWFEGLSYFGASFAPRAVELVLDQRFEADRSWPVVGGMLAHTPTRDAAWRAVKARLGELLATLGAHEAAIIIESTAGLCDAQKRGEVETAFSPHVSTIEGGKRALAQALASIDRCIKAAP
jgi:hypothetical protein